jgi:hypothetical protein
MNKLLAATGWTLRVSALVCIVWIVAQVLGGHITSFTEVLASVVWHAGFALSGVTLVGASRRATRHETSHEPGSEAAAMK